MDYLRRNKSKIYRIFLFLSSLLLIVYVFPREAKFRYEFQHGTPWLHDNLFATSSFPIYKLDSELAGERDSLLRSFMPYYQLDSSIYLKQISSLKIRFEQKWNANFPTENLKKRDKRYIAKLKQSYLLLVEDLFQNTYKQGIIKLSDLADLHKKNYAHIKILQNRIAQQVSVNKLFSSKSAYKLINSKIDKISTKSKRIDSLCRNLAKLLNLNEFIAPNLRFDKKLTAKAKQNLFNKISPTRGMVQAGEAIILKGELIDKQKFRILESLKKEYENTEIISKNLYWVFLGQLLLIAIVILVLFLFLMQFRADIFYSFKKLLLVLILLVFPLVVASLIVKVDYLNLYFLPFALVPIILLTLFDARLALFVHLLLILLIGFLAPNGFEFAFVQFFSGFIAIFSLKNLHTRSQFFAAAGITVTAYYLLYFSISIIYEPNLTNISWINFAWFTLNGLLLFLAAPLIYVFEKTFGLLSDLSLLELSNSNNPLLRKLAEHAPGTFQHSLQVANLAEAAIYRIGGNPLLVRTGALYHDIGKLYAPNYFIENQAGMLNPHDKISPEKSAKIIIGHVTEGLKIAQNHKLPEQVSNFIVMHHGKSKVLYFYRKYLEQHTDNQLSINNFSYPGPKPALKEHAVLMMADAIEAASRSLKVINKESLSQLVDGIVSFQMSENQFDDAAITFKEINLTKEIFVEKLLNIYHARIEYPK